MRKLISVFSFSMLILLISCETHKDVYEKFYKDLPFETIKPELPVWGKLTKSLTDFGGIGDGQTLNDKAFHQAIDYISSHGGGKLTVPRGIWLTGPIELKSNLNLHLEEGALILMSEDLSLYPVIEREGTSGVSYKVQSPVSAYNCENIAITGKGIIDGNGHKWRYRKKGKFTDSQWKEIKASGGVITPDGERWYPTQEAMDVALGNKRIRGIEDVENYKSGLTPKMVSFVNCQKILLQGVTFENPPNWNIHPLCCEDLTIDGISIRSAWSAQNSDALDIESCNRVLIVNSSFDVGDDAICIKSGKDKAGRLRGMPSQHIVIDNCTVYHGHGGFVIGSEMSGGVKNISVRNCTFIGTDVGLRFKSTRGRGGVVENIYIDGIEMINIDRDAIIFELFYGNADRNLPIPPVTEETPLFHNIYFKNIYCHGANRAVYIIGLPEMNVQNITFEDMKISSKRGVSISWADQICFKNCEVITQLNELSEAIELFESSTINTKGLNIHLNQ